MDTKPFSADLQKKIESLAQKRSPIKLGRVHFDSPLLLAPMAGICTPPFRLLMEDLGAGGTVSELISCHGINHANERTLNMLKIDERERNIGLQLFGESPEAMAQASEVAQKYNPKFIDINMGCPVRKVVTKGGGSALLREPKELIPYLSAIKEVLDVPLTIKIRTGWDEDSINADEVIKIAHDMGVEWVAVHGRTRAQAYMGKANWEYLEELAEKAPLPIIGNGDLHQPHLVKARMNNTQCEALMIARGCLRNPFIFLESYADENDPKFLGSDYFEAISRLHQYTNETYDNERIKLIQMRKLIVWFAAGFPGAAKFRALMFTCPDLADSMKIAEDYYLSLGDSTKFIDYNEVFMNGGHG